MHSHQERVVGRLRHHPEKHLVDRIGWLRAAVLGANDGIISTASLIVGVAAAAAKQNDVLVAGVAGLVAGFLALLGAMGGKAGGANILRATLRVTFWGALALGITAGIGKLFGTVV